MFAIFIPSAITIFSQCKAVRRCVTHRASTLFRAAGAGHFWDDQCMGQLQFFSAGELAAMRDRTRSRRYSPVGEQFRREHARHRAWGLARRHAEKLRRVRAEALAAVDGHREASVPESPPAVPSEQVAPPASLSPAAPPASMSDAAPPASLNPAERPSSNAGSGKTQGARRRHAFKRRFTPTPPRRSDRIVKAHRRRGRMVRTEPASHYFNGLWHGPPDDDLHGPGSGGRPARNNRGPSPARTTLIRWSGGPKAAATIGRASFVSPSSK
jgi:hypothetical protein